MFKEQTGKDLPTKPLWDETWRQFLEFRYRSVERLAQRMREAALACNPDLCVVMNYHGSPNIDWRVGQMPVRHSLYSDLGTGETYTPMLGDMYPGLESRFIRCLVPGKPYEIVSWRMNRVPTSRSSLPISFDGAFCYNSPGRFSYAYRPAVS